MKRSLAHQGGPVDSSGDAAMATVLAGALRATGDEPSGLTHGFHSYPARMHPALAGQVLASLAPRDATVLDPFCGGGTVLVEALVAGCKPVGTDLSPLALRIAQVRAGRRPEAERQRFTTRLQAVATAADQRVRERIPVRAALPVAMCRLYQGHVLKELAGLAAEIATIKPAADRRALEMVLSAVVIKFSDLAGDTTQGERRKRIGKGVPTKFFARKGAELCRAWAELDAACPETTARPRLEQADARHLGEALGPRFGADLVLTSPPYGGTYDYAEQQAVRAAWLGLSMDRLRRGELGARRNLSARTRGAAKRWDRELGQALASIAGVMRRDATAVIVLGDAHVGGHRVPADAQLQRLAPAAGLAVVAAASAPRPDWRGGAMRREHVVALVKGAGSGSG